MNAFLERLYQSSRYIPLSTTAASLAFYTTLSIPPLAVLFFGLIQYLELPLVKALNQEIDDLLVGEVSSFVKLILNKEDLLKHTKKFQDGFGVLIILFSSSLIFRELRRAFNHIFQFHQESPKIRTKGQLIWKFIKREFFPFMSVVVFVVLLLLYLTSSSSIVSLIPLDYSPKWFFYHNVVAFSFFTAIFAILFRFAPDYKTSWLRSFMGGLITTIFCMMGTHFVGVYIAKLFVFNFFGIFGPLFLFLIWVYYSYFMILLGAIVCASL